MNFLAYPTRPGHRADETLAKINGYVPCSIGGGVSNVLHFTTAAPVPNSGHGSGLNLSTNNGLDLSLPNYEGLDLCVTSSTNAAAAVTTGGGGGTSKRQQQQRHVQQQQQPGQQLVGYSSSLTGLQVKGHPLANYPCFDFLVLFCCFLPQEF